jgi:hypothetical protein
MTVPSGAEVRPGLAAAVLRYLEEHPHAVDTARGIATYWLHGIPCEMDEVEFTLDTLTARGTVERTATADGTRLYGKRLERG